MAVNRMAVHLKRQGYWVNYKKGSSFDAENGIADGHGGPIPAYAHTIFTLLAPSPVLPATVFNLALTCDDPDGSQAGSQMK
jgi:hypothetical protein